MAGTGHCPGIDRPTHGLDLGSALQDTADLLAGVKSDHVALYREMLSAAGGHYRGQEARAVYARSVLTKPLAPHGRQTPRIYTTRCPSVVQTQ